MNYGAEFIKKHIGKITASTKKGPSDPKRRKSDTGTMSTVKIKYDYEDDLSVTKYVK